MPFRWHRQQIGICKQAAGELSDEKYAYEITRVATRHKLPAFTCWIADICIKKGNLIYQIPFSVIRVMSGGDRKRRGSLVIPRPEVTISLVAAALPKS